MLRYFPQWSRFNFNKEPWALSIDYGIGTQKSGSSAVTGNLKLFYKLLVSFGGFFSGVDSLSFNSFQGFARNPDIYTREYDIYEGQARHYPFAM